jgi:hypothetical protein
VFGDGASNVTDELQQLCNRAQARAGCIWVQNGPSLVDWPSGSHDAAGWNDSLSRRAEGRTGQDRGSKPSSACLVAFRCEQDDSHRESTGRGARGTRGVVRGCPSGGSLLAKDVPGLHGW